MDNLERAICHNINIAIFKRTAPGTFETYGMLPDWLPFHLAAATHSRLRLADYLASMESFLQDAEIFWRLGKTQTLDSGTLVETPLDGREILMVATAMKIDGEDILLLQNPGEHFRDEVNRLHRVHEDILLKERIDNEVARKTLRIKRQEEDITIKLVSLTSYRDEESEAHVKRIGLYAAAIAKALNWPEEKVDNIRIAATMHDIGKLGIPDQLLLKEGALTEEEFEIMKRHTEIGANLLDGTDIPVLNMASEIALYHHECWNGEGYPKALKGREIPVAARITSIVDKYDVLIHERVYRQALPEDVVIEHLQEMSGRELDPQLVEMFLRLLPTMQRIRSEVKDYQYHKPQHGQLAELF